MLIVGEKEEFGNSMSVREHGKGDLGSFSITDFVKHINQKIENDFNPSNKN